MQASAARCRRFCPRPEVPGVPPNRRRYTAFAWADGLKTAYASFSIVIPSWLQGARHGNSKGVLRVAGCASNPPGRRARKHRSPGVWAGSTNADYIQAQTFHERCMAPVARSLAAFSGRRAIPQASLSVKTNPIREALQLSSGDLLCIVNGCGMHVSVQHGCLLATQERDPEDTLVTSEAPFCLAVQGKTILAARCDALVVLDGHAASITVKRYCGSTPVVLYEVRDRNVPRIRLGKLCFWPKGDIAT